MVYYGEVLYWYWWNEDLDDSEIAKKVFTFCEYLIIDNYKSI